MRRYTFIRQKRFSWCHSNDYLLGILRRPLVRIFLGKNQNQRLKFWSYSSPGVHQTCYFMFVQFMMKHLIYVFMYRALECTTSHNLYMKIRIVSTIIIAYTFNPMNYQISMAHSLFSHYNCEDRHKLFEIDLYQIDNQV